jgi:hypothetical protein
MIARPPERDSATLPATTPTSSSHTSESQLPPNNEVRREMRRVLHMPPDQRSEPPTLTHDRALQGRLLSRGVWHAPYTVSGQSVIVAIDSAGDRVAERVILPGDDAESAAECLEAVLDLVDPPRALGPRLELVQ